MLNNTPFLNFMKSYANPESYMNSFKNVPNLDFSSIVGTAQRVMDIVTTTNQIATESIQELIKKNSEILQDNVNNMLDSVKKTASAKDFTQASECHQECLKSLYETSMNNMKDIANIAYGTSAKILEAMNKHAPGNVYSAPESTQKGTFNKKNS